MQDIIKFSLVGLLFSYLPRFWLLKCNNFQWSDTLKPIRIPYLCYKLKETTNTIQKFTISEWLLPFIHTNSGLDWCELDFHRHKQNTEQRLTISTFTIRKSAYTIKVTNPGCTACAITRDSIYIYIYIYIYILITKHYPI